MTTRIKTIGRDEYIASIRLFQDSESCRFANQALAWWDRHFSWRAQGCDVLVGPSDEPLSYIFSKVDRYSEYLTVYNLFTPLGKQRNGYAHELLRLTMENARERHVRRITFSSVSASLDFYLDMGFIFWGINDIGDYHCDLPIPKEGLAGMEKMTKNGDLKILIGQQIEKIYAKVSNNEIRLTPPQLLRYKKDRLKLGSKCRFESLSALRELIAIAQGKAK